MKHKLCELNVTDTESRVSTAETKFLQLKDRNSCEVKNEESGNVV